MEQAHHKPAIEKVMIGKRKPMRVPEIIEQAVPHQPVCRTRKARRVAGLPLSSGSLVRSADRYWR